MRPLRGAGGRSPMKRLLCLIPCVHRHAGEAQDHQLETSVPVGEPSEPVRKSRWLPANMQSDLPSPQLSLQDLRGM